MRSTKGLLERAGRAAPSPGFGLDDLERRRDRRRSRQRIGAAAVALTLTAGVAGIVFGLAGLRDDGNTVASSTETAGASGALPAATAAPIQADLGEYYYARTWRHAVDSCGFEEDPMRCTFATGETETWWFTDESGRISDAGGAETFAPGEFPNDTITTGLPTDPARLRDALFARSGPDGASPEPQTTVSPGQDGMDASVEQSIVNLLEMSNTTPALRAALLEVLAGMPAATVELGATDPAGRPAFRITVTTFGGPTVHELYVDPATHELLAHVQTAGDGALWAENVLLASGLASSTGAAPATSVVPEPLRLPEVADGPSPLPVIGPSPTG